MNKINKFVLAQLRCWIPLESRRFEIGRLFSGRLQIKYFLLTFAILVALGITISFADAQETGEEVLVDPEPGDTVHFVMSVRWGNVLDEPIDTKESNFDGSIFASATSTPSTSTKISLIRTLLFEHHSENADKITSEADPVSWNSLIYGHWDGLKVLVSAPASENITVSVTPGSITKTAEEFYTSREPIIQEVGNGKEIVIKTHPVQRHAFIAKILWGKVDRNEYAKTSNCEENPTDSSCISVTKEDFSGSLTLTSGGKMKFIKTLRFEGDDKINSQSETLIDWTSNIFGAVDGVLVKFVLDKNVTKDTSVTLTFPAQGYEKSKPLLELYHKRFIKSEVKPGYGAWAVFWHHPDRKLIRAKNRAEVYMMEDGLRRHIPNPQVFTDQGLDWNDVEVVEPDEVDVLSEDAALSYTEGSIIQGEGPEVYAIANGQKQHITNPQVFANLQYDWRNIIKVSNKELALYPTGTSLKANSKHPDKSLVRFENEPTVYVIEGDRLKPITSPQAFASQNFKWERVKVLNRALKNQYRVGKELALGDGALIREPSGKVYRVDQGKKRWIRTARDLVRGGHKFERVINVSPKEAATIPEGEDIVADDTR